MTSEEIRSRFLAFFEKRGHKIIPSASLVPENDPSVLFNTAGMQPLVPYLMGEPHPAGDKLASAQKCVRTNDIDEVGDNTHLTFFEMLGNWSLGAYFKDEAIEMSWDLLTKHDEGFGLEPARLYVTCFEGDTTSPKDEYSAGVWRKLFTEAGINADHHIFFLPADKNWWSPGDNGPCGPDTEMYYDVAGDVKIENLADFKKADDNQEIVEIWNDVFMEYEKQNGQVIGKLARQNVDTGSGLERVTIMLQGKKSVYDTDLFIPIITKIKTLANLGEVLSDDQEKAVRIVADHLRASTFLIADGVIPSNTDRGYILRRLIRRAVRYGKLLGIENNFAKQIAEVIVQKYSGAYPELGKNKEQIYAELEKEEEKFRKTLDRGLKILDRQLEGQVGSRNQYNVEEINLVEKDGSHIWDHRPAIISGKWLFDFYQTIGFPPELTFEELKARGLPFSNPDIQKLMSEFDLAMKDHQALSRAGAEQKFKGGLGGSSEQIVKYHTATHLLQQALVDVLGPEVEQKGSNITDERLRFDFAFGRKMTDEEKGAVEKIVNEKIAADLPVQKVVLPKAEAEKSGARHLFSEKYGDEVNIYFIGDSLETSYSKEFCGGPHVDHTGALGHFKISKEEAVAAGVRRIKAVLE